jgi:hypothetical protein
MSITPAEKALPRFVNYIANLTTMSRFSVALSLFAGCFVCGLAESGAVVLEAGFDTYVQQICDDLHVPGLSLAVVRKDSFESKVRPKIFSLHWSALV